jgi:ubiquinone/menaquinone biosynthesis C-methylase UbiE
MREGHPTLLFSNIRQELLTMSDLNEIYNSQATRYQDLISHEDVDNNLLPAIETIVSLKGKCLLDLGTGTGRIPLLVSHLTSYVIGIDLHWDMLREQKTQQKGRGTWDLLQADFRFLPYTNRRFDIITAGWSISALCSSEKEIWKNQIGLVMKEIHRAIKSGGIIIIIETMSTASSTPAPPHEDLAAYYEWLENTWGFTPQTIQTDYQFGDLEQAVTAIDFFFGPEMAALVKEKKWVRVPEWTGIWSKTAPE